MKLSEKPFSELRVGDRLISALGTPGSITRLLPEGKGPNTDRYDSVEIKWDSESVSLVFHMNADKVTIA
jgi:hypothetical protein